MVVIRNYLASILMVLFAVSANATSTKTALDILANQTNQFVITTKSLKESLTIRKIIPKLNSRIGNTQISESLISKLKLNDHDSLPHIKTSATRNLRNHDARATCIEKSKQHNDPHSKIICLDNQGSLDQNANEQLTQFLESAEIVTANVVTEDPETWEAIQEKIDASDAVLVDITNEPTQCSQCENYTILSTRPFK